MSKAGFRSYVQTGIELQVGSNPVIPVVLGVGQLSESIQVEASATSVETRNAGVGTVIETQRILDLPLNGRQATDLITLSGLAVQTGAAPQYSMPGGVNISVAGGMSYSIQYNLDGAPHLDTFDGTNMPLPFPDALQEFKLVTSSQDASSGGHSAASVNSVTKSGNNAFHGDLFEFIRNGALNGRDFFATRDDQLKRNQFGGVLGGPIRKDNRRLPGHTHSPDSGHPDRICSHRADVDRRLYAIRRLRLHEWRQLKRTICQQPGESRSVKSGSHQYRQKASPDHRSVRTSDNGRPFA